MLLVRENYCPDQVTFSGAEPSHPTTAEDLRWWSLLLPRFNSVLFFDDKSRPIFHLFTDASQVGLGGFWYLGLSPDFMTMVPSTPKENSFAQRLKRDPLQTFDSNIYEMRAVLAAFHKWQHLWTVSQ
jgi:hypothetical protein